MASLKTYWSLLKTLLNKKNASLLQDNKYVTDLKKKAELFNFFFAEHCTKIDNRSELRLNFPKKQTNLSLQLLSLVMILQY